VSGGQQTFPLTGLFEIWMCEVTISVSRCGSQSSMLGVSLLGAEGEVVSNSDFIIAT
jgi:hypothetical protein